MRTRNVFAGLLSLASLLPLAKSLRADMAPVHTGGTNPAVLLSKEIVPVTMVWEEVDLHPSPEKNQVKAVFLMKNTAEKEVQLTVGFPSYYEGELHDFLVEIDGKKQLAEAQKEVHVIPKYSKKTFTYWLCWPMTFAAGAEHKISVSYWCKTEQDLDAFFEDDKFYRETFNLSEMPDDLKTKLVRCSSGYVLRTGAAWQGNIGKATIRLHYDGVRRECVDSLIPKEGWVFDGKTDTATLELKDFKPESDIRYCFRLVNTEEEIKLLSEAKRLGPTEKQYLERLKNKVERLKNQGER